MADHQSSTTVHEEISATSSDGFYSELHAMHFPYMPMNEILGQLRFEGIFAECINKAKGLMKNG